MFGIGGGMKSAILEAFSKSQAIIEFDMTGTILTANANFCLALGYDVSEIKGKHHRIFVDPAQVSRPEYQAFWAKLGRGEYDSGQYKRIGKGGREIWIEASYNPVFVGKRLVKVVKIATDITEQKFKATEDAGKLAALSRAQAIIEFTPKGEILTANENFLRTLGYQLQDIVGRHHSMFCEPDYVKTEDYASFWRRLAAGEFVSDEFLRIGRNGKRVHIQASYNPILDDDGKVLKVVKFATDVTPRVENVTAIAGALRQLSEGDLTVQLTSPFLPVFEQVRADFNNAAGKLRTALQTVAHNAGAISAASQEISSASNELAQRTERQAASIEETAAALEEITTTGADSSQRAQEAGELVRKTKENAERSGQIVREAVDAMGKIETSASEIGSIIGVIDEIAFQTNLLALNAGVEAARAGEAGKGFAVVAQEVRELAQRSAKAAKEIKDLISTSNGHVKSGVALVGETGKALQDIVDQVVRVDGNVGAIAESSREQATGLKEINTAVNTMDQSTQQNAAMVEETTAAAHSLAKDAEALFEIVSQFKVESNSPRAQRPDVVTKASNRLHESPARQLVTRVQQSVQGATALKTETWEEF